jgi:hypothetical protein
MCTSERGKALLSEAAPVEQCLCFACGFRLQQAAASSDAAASGAEPPLPDSALAAAPCRVTCTCGEEGNQCADDLAQNDLAPTLSALLGVPIPFGNLGKASPEMWAMARRHCERSGGVGGSGSGWEASLRELAAANAEQVCVGRGGGEWSSWHSLNIPFLSRCSWVGNFACLRNDAGPFLPYQLPQTSLLPGCRCSST